MNRTNRSGIIKGGVIGGKSQSGLWKLDARYNKDNLVERIKRIAKLKKKIHLYNKDIESFLINYIPKYENKSFVYFDPPYFNKGKQLYMNFFNYENHIQIEKYISKYVKCDWIITYDYVPEILDIYDKYFKCSFDLNYSAANKRKAKELMVFKDKSLMPHADFNHKPININLTAV